MKDYCFIKILHTPNTPRLSAIATQVARRKSSLSVSQMARFCSGFLLQQMLNDQTKIVGTQPLEMFSGDDLRVTDLYVSHVAATVKVKVLCIASDRGLYHVAWYSLTPTANPCVTR